MHAGPTHAEQYTRNERIRIASFVAAPMVCVVVAMELWGFPAFKAFASTAHCRTVWGVSGTVVLFNGVFVGIPLFSAAMTFATFGRRGLKILRHGQAPLPGEKVFRPTPIRRGKVARRIGILHLLAAIPLLCISLWGYLQTRHFVDTISRNAADVATSCVRTQPKKVNGWH